MKTRNTRKYLSRLALALALSVTASTASAQDPDLLVYEGFDYEVDSTLEFQEGGTGFSGSWSFRQSILGGGSGGPVLFSSILTAGSLTYSNLQTSGNHLHMYGDRGDLQLARRIDGGVPAVPGTSIYISFLGQRVGPQADPTDKTIYPDPDGYPWGENLYPRGASVRFFNNTNSEKFSIGLLSNRSHTNWMLFSQGLNDETGVSIAEAPGFVVIRVDFKEEGVPDDVHMWVNPDLSQAPDIASANVSKVNFFDGTNPLKFNDWTVLSLWAGNGSTNRPYAELLVDEFRIGKTYASVTPTGGDTPGLYVDDVLGRHHYFGQGWAWWIPEAADGAEWGIIQVSQRDENGGGWIYHDSRGWLFLVTPGNVDTGLYAYSETLGWLYISTAASADSLYSYDLEQWVSFSAE